MLLSPRVVLHQSNHSSGQALQGGVGRECVLGKSQVLSSWVRLRDKCQPSPWAVISKVPVAHLGGYAAGASLSPANSSPSRQLVDILEPESVTLQTLALISFPLAEQFLVWYKVHPLKSRGNLLAKFQGIISPGKLSLSHQAAHLAGVFKKKKLFPAEDQLARLCQQQGPHGLPEVSQHRKTGTPSLGTLKIWTGLLPSMQRLSLKFNLNFYC